MAPARAQQDAGNPDARALDTILRTAKPGQPEIAIGDMRFRPEVLQGMRDHFARGSKGAITNGASEANIVLWPNGIVYYQFAANVNALHQKAFLDAAAEWVAWGKVTFTVAGSGQANYVLVNDGGSSLEGGNSYVGMAGGQQALNIGTTSWNRATLCHEIGHTLGFVHEHQRSDRDSYVQIFTQNTTDGGADFVKLTDSVNKTAYDFESIMHYSRNAFSANPTPANPNLPDPNSDTIEPLAGYMQFLNVMGRETDRTLSKLDRAAVASLYGAPALTPSLTVTNTKDSGPGSLRTAIYYAYDLSVNNPGSTNAVLFHIPTTDPGYSASSGIFTIPLTFQLTAPGDGTVIDGATQTAFTGDTDAKGPEISLSGAGILASEYLYAAGVHLRAANCTVANLAIGKFDQQGIALFGSTATGNVVQGCRIGTNPAGSAAAANAYAGIEIYSGARGNTIGGSTTAARNVVSGNGAQGIYIHDAGTTGNSILGNFLGTNQGGAGAVANTYAGIEIGLGATGNTVGGASAATRNFISGNKYQGVFIDGAGTSGNLVQGNYIGVNSAGTAALANGFDDKTNHIFAPGVQIYNGATNNTVGGSSAGARNVISGNAAEGVSIDGTGTTGNIVKGDYIGLNAAGTAAVANGAADPANNYNYPGVDVFGGATANVIGGTVGGTGNVISGNAAQGVIVQDAGTAGTLVAGNIIGLNAAGTAAVANGYAGVSIYGGAVTNTIGGVTAADRNIISGNGNQGITISDTGTKTNIVEGNYIGLNKAGSAAIGNLYAGVSLYGGAQSNRIGGSTIGAGNVISGNTDQGVTISDSGTNSNAVSGNWIGLDATGLNQVANGDGGVEIFGGARSNLVGGALSTTAGLTSPLGRNYLAGNGTYGIAISGTNTNSNLVYGNTIGLNLAGTAISNTYQGVVLFSGAQSNLIGGTGLGASNVISGNTAAGGVALYDSTTIHNSIEENSIYANGGTELALYNSANSSLGAPTLTKAVLGLNTTVSGSLSGGVASASHRIEFFATPAGVTGGKSFVGSVNVTTNSSGAATFSGVNLIPKVPAGSLLVATVTSPAGDTSAFSNAFTVTTTDTDGDGMPDVYETAHGFNPNNASDASQDADGDGMTNLQEYRAGTDPNNANSYLQITSLTRTGTNVVLSFPSVVNQLYRLESTANLNANTTWQLQTDAIPGTGNAVQITLTGAANETQQFFRVVADP